MPFREEGRGKGEGALPFPARVARVVRRIIGAPDYGAYLAHCREAGHPPRLSEREYVKEFLDSKGGVRCC
ncbi:MAG TPA: YbdD/YjiX family protein [Gemmatimonadales bacterium]